VLPWTRRTATQTARRYHVPLADVWDEALTALVRAQVYFQPGAGTFHAYARRAVTRGLWRYVGRAALRRPTTALTDLTDLATCEPSAETIVAACEVLEHQSTMSGDSPPARHRAVTASGM
jgi:hypothetical protein